MGRSPGRWGREGVHRRHRAGPGGYRGGDHHRVPRSPWIRNVVPEGTTVPGGGRRNISGRPSRGTRGGRSPGPSGTNVKYPGVGGSEASRREGGASTRRTSRQGAGGSPRREPRRSREKRTCLPGIPPEGAAERSVGGAAAGVCGEGQREVHGTGGGTAYTGYPRRRVRGRDGGELPRGPSRMPWRLFSTGTGDVLEGGPAGGDRRDEGSGDRDDRRRYRERAGTCTPAPRRREVHRLPVSGAATTCIAYRGDGGLEGM